MRKIKTYSTNPELFVVGALCQVSMPTKWIGAVSDDPIVWLPAKITKIEPSKSGSKYPCICVRLRASHKYHTCSIENLMILPSQVEMGIRFR